MIIWLPEHAGIGNWSSEPGLEEESHADPALLHPQAFSKIIFGSPEKSCRARTIAISEQELLIFSQ